MKMINELDIMKVQYAATLAEIDYQKQSMSDVIGKIEDSERWYKKLSILNTRCQFFFIFSAIYLMSMALISFSLTGALAANFNFLRSIGEFVDLYSFEFNLFSYALIALVLLVFILLNKKNKKFIAESMRLYREHEVKTNEVSELIQEKLRIELVLHNTPGFRADSIDAS